MFRTLTKLLAAVAVLAVLGPVSSAFAGGTTTGADLQVSGSSNNGSPYEGQTYQYTYQVKNSGPMDATGSTFTDNLPAGTVNYVTLDGATSPCSHTTDGSGGTAISCNLGTIAKGSQATVVESVNAPATVGSLSNTGSASSGVADPQPSNNSSTVTVTVKSTACPLPADQTTLNGVVASKDTNSSGMFENFQLYGSDGVSYTVLTNFYDGTSPLTTVINLACKQSPNSFIQVGNSVNVTGTIDSEVLPGATQPTPVIHASFVQVMTFNDKI